jgi:site-specific DNA-methyltransferase (adenine-specific)
MKSVELMKWLCRLITPPNGVILDPFAGSGSTGVAAMRERFRFIGIEQEADFVKIARSRIVQEESDVADEDRRARAR